MIITTKRLNAFFEKYLSDLFFSIQASAAFPILFRSILWRMKGFSVGHPAYIGAGWHIVGRNLAVGNGCVFGYGGYIDCSGSVKIGDRVHFGPKVIILSATHRIMPSVYRRDPWQIDLLETEIGRGCWIGSGAKIIAGVKIGEGCVIGAGAVVCKDCEPNGLYVGVPARRIKDLPVE